VVDERSSDGLVNDRAVYGITRPRLAVFAPDRPNGAAVMITPGGGYRWVVVDKEGYEIGRWLAARGFTAFVLFYRLPGEGWASGPDAPLADAQRAMRLIRSRAKDFAIDPERVAAMGFSAGGHVCADLGARFNARVYAPVDAADQLSARPHCAAPLYPVVSMDPAIAHKGSREKLLAPRPPRRPRPPTPLTAISRRTPRPTSCCTPRMTTSCPWTTPCACTPPYGPPAGRWKCTSSPMAAMVLVCARRWASRWRPGLTSGAPGPGQWAWVDGAGLMELDRRQALGLAALGSAGLGGASLAAPQTRKPGRGPENQAAPDQGHGRFLNPILSGDRPDPAILQDGEDYYLTFSSFDAYPGLTIWHSRDLVNWTPRGSALTRNIGSVWAVSLAKHRDRYFIYIPVKAAQNDIFVTWADQMDGPWSDPVSLGLHSHIDPCHAVDEDGGRWLFLSGGDRVRLSGDGLSVAGPVEHVYDPWRYPDDWDVEGFSPEGPKILQRDGWYYMLTAVGGTAGPPTGHMVIAARSRSLHGPWTQHPGNPLVRTTSADEAWWSRGHASLVEGPDGSWWAIYHGYRAGFWTLGRQCLLDPVEWTPDGWFRMTGGDLSRPLRKPGGGQAPPHGMALSDRFEGPLALGRKWTFFRPAVDEQARIRVADGKLHLTGKGLAPSSGSPLLLTTGDTSYAFECDIELGPGPRRAWSFSMTIISIAAWASTPAASSPTSTALSAPGRSIPMGGGCAYASPTVGTLSPSIPAAMAARPGGGSIGGWRCPAITTMCGAASAPAARPLRRRRGRDRLQQFHLHRPGRLT